MNLDQAIAKRAKEISTESYAMSVGELLSLYRDNELNLHPEFQRFFRWSDQQKSRLIESFLLGIPVPPVFVSQDEKGKWDVIDGLQRLSTIFQLTGDLLDEEGKPVKPLLLTATKYLPQLQNKRWKLTGGEPGEEITEAAKLILKRARIDIKIVLNKSDASSKYELFDRLNTGGSSATDQEVRNCMLVMISKKFFGWFADLAKDENFQATYPLTDRQLLEKFDMELVVRFLCLRQKPEKTLGEIVDLGPFLTERIIEIAQDEKFDFAAEETAFKQTFKAIAEALGEDSFRKFNAAKDRPSGPPLVSVFEILALGVGFHILDPKFKPALNQIQKAHREIWVNPEFTSGTGSGIRATSRLPLTIPLGRKIFQPWGLLNRY
jgi:hypothetical protein